MYLQQIRNATIFLYYGGKTFLIGTILAQKGRRPQRVREAMAGVQKFKGTFPRRYFIPVLLK